MQANLAAELSRLGLQKVFDAHVVRSDNPEMHFMLSTHYDTATVDVQEAQVSLWG